jgi:hypothetical protein
VQKCFRLANKQQELEKLHESLGGQSVTNALAGWNISGGFVPADVVRLAWKEKSKDKEVYRYYLGLAELEKVEDRLDKKLGCYVRGCVVTKDVHDLGRIIKAIENISYDAAPVIDLEQIDQKRLRYLNLIGKGEDGKINRMPALTVSSLARRLGLSKAEIRRFNIQYGVSPAKGRPGRPKKD